MIILNAQQLQRVAEMLQQVERRQEAGGGEAHLVEEGLQEVAIRTGVELGILRVATADTLLGVLGPEGTGDPGKLWLAAEILRLEWRRARAAGDDAPATGDLREKALRLYEAVDPKLLLPRGSVTPKERIRELTSD
jgi:hypothetical protein